MTDEQKKLVEDNIALVRFTINKYHPTLACDEDIYQIGCMGIIEAAKVFDHSKCEKFSCIAVMCIKRHIYRYFRHRCTKKECVNHMAISFYKIQNESSSEKYTTLCEFIASDLDTEKAALSKVNYSTAISVINRLPEKQKKAMLLSMEGYNQQQIARMLNMSQMSISRYLKLSREAIAEVVG